MIVGASDDICNDFRNDHDCHDNDNNNDDDDDNDNDDDDDN